MNKEKMDKISIVMPCFKSEKFIGNMIEDIIAQSYSNWELIIVSNGEGQDVQLTVVNEYAAKDERICVYSIKDGGVSKARNFGMNKATGGWLTFVDADDRLTHDYLESLFSGVSSSCDVVIGGYIHHDVSKNIYSRIISPQICGIDRQFVEMFDVIKKSPCTKLFRVEALRKWGGEFDTSLTLSEDAVFCYSFYLYSRKVVSVPMSGYIYNWGNQGSATSKYHECGNYVEDLILKLEKDFINLVDEDEGWKSQIYNRLVYLSSYFRILNYFRQTPLPCYHSLKKDIVRTSLSHDVRSSLKFQKSYPANIFTKIYNVGVKLNSPAFLYLYFYFLKKVKSRSK